VIDFGRAIPSNRSAAPTAQFAGDNASANPTFDCVAACSFPVTCQDGTTGCADKSDPCASHGGECSSKGDSCVTDLDCCSGLRCDNDSAKPTFDCVAH
jgi:hypothetical protein